MKFNLGLRIFGGLIFTLVGIYGLIFSSEKIYNALLNLLIGGWLLYIHIFGALSKSVEKLEEIITINHSDVEQIILKPTKRMWEKNYSLTKTELYINDRKSIEIFCETLNNATRTSDRYVKRAEWLALIILKKNLETIKFGVKKKGHKTSITVFSDGEYGWNYGTLKCNNLGSVLENEVKNRTL